MEDETIDFEFTLNSIINAITRKINEIFGEDYNIEVGNVKQGFETPCFFVKCLNGDDKNYRGKRYQKNLNFNIIGFSKNDIVTELYDMSDKLYNLEYITLDNGDLLRCINRTHRIEDNTLQFFFDIKCFIYKKSITITEQNMEDVTVKIKEQEV